MSTLTVTTSTEDLHGPEHEVYLPSGARCVIRRTAERSSLSISRAVETYLPNKLRWPMDRTADQRAVLKALTACAAAACAGPWWRDETPETVEYGHTGRDTTLTCPREHEATVYRALALAESHMFGPALMYVASNSDYHRYPIPERVHAMLAELY